MLLGLLLGAVAGTGAGGVTWLVRRCTQPVSYQRLANAPAYSQI
jgi:hypothetical protein